METATLAAVFFGVWLVLLFGYCVFRLCGGKLVDVFSCDCCGPCWGNGGRIDELDYEYPFSEDGARARIELLRNCLQSSLFLKMRWEQRRVRVRVR